MTEKDKKVIPEPQFAQAWEKNSNTIWLATTICLHRNIDKFNFPQKLDVEKRQLVLDLLEKAIRSDSGLQDITLYPEDQMHPIDRELVFEHFLIFDAGRNFQRGQALVTEASGTVIFQINVHDHLEMMVLETRAELEKALESLSTLERRIEKRIPFAFSNQFGFVTANPSLSGTGLVVRAYVHIPALVQSKSWCQAVQEDRKEGLVFTSLRGNPEDPIGNILVVSNRWTTGVTEEMILSSVRNTVLKLIAEEEAARHKIQESRDDQIIDHVSRSIGVLQHSFTIDTNEALKAISFVKFGIELGWVSGMTIESANELLFDCRRAHMAKKLNPSLYATPQLYKSRAQYLREIMTPVSITVP